MSFELLQEPQLSTSMQVLQCLSPRTKLSSQEKHQLSNRLKGFAGEKVFADFLHEQNGSNRLTLYNLRLATNDTEFEMDCLVMQDDMLYLFEVKNYEGDFLYEDGQWFVVHNKKEISDPLAQLQRSEMLLKQTLHRLNLNIPVRGYVVFVHSNFQLYHAPLGKNIIYPAQLQRFFTNFSANNPPLQPRHELLMNRLSAMHVVHSHHIRLPDYDFSTLRKGVLCQVCKNILSLNGRKLFYCQHCNVMECIEAGVLRMTEQFSTLFPDERITTRKIFTWCGEIVSMKVVRKVLKQHFEMKGNSKGVYFTLK
ncbi:MAG TPA: nuclease-related domain-containing protein [Pseudogracilibacillus sp.]|nr:nuclease-related domain-containing protein [Pseudogracilibacillus sp.]